MIENSQKGQGPNIRRPTNIEIPQFSQTQKNLLDTLPSPQPMSRPQLQPQTQPQLQPGKTQEKIQEQPEPQQCCGIVRQPTDRLFATILWISLGSCIGVTIRILLTVAGQSFHKQITTVLKLLGFSFFLPNVVGCFIMGFFVALKNQFQAHHKYLIIGITTGFCGSCTTLSSYMVGLGALFFIGYNWMNALLLIVVQFAVYMCALYFGFHFAKLINMNKMPAIPEIPWWICGIFLVLYITGACFGAAFNEPNRARYIAVMFGPFGAVTRYLLGLYNQKKFPLGTFIANVVASFLLTLLFLGNYSQSFDKWYTIFGMGGVGTGIMGSLSTVSSWVNQIKTLAEQNLKYSYFYGILTVLVIQFMIALIFGIWIGTDHIIK